MSVKNNSGTRMTKTSIKSAMAEVTQPKVYTADQDYYIWEQQEGATAVESNKRLLVRAGAQITEAEIDRQFPTAAVYGPTARSELRLITCGGRFDRTARSYTDNVVVEAVAV